MTEPRTRNLGTGDLEEFRQAGHWLVDAIVSSAPTEPVSQYASRSGIISSRRAAANRDGGSAASWWIVLNGRNCRPVVSYSRAAPNRSGDAGAVRASR